MVVDQLSPGFAFVSATPSVGTYNPGNGVWNVGPLANGAPSTSLIVARVAGPGTHDDDRRAHGFDGGRRRLDTEQRTSPVEDDQQTTVGVHHRRDAGRHGLVRRRPRRRTRRAASLASPGSPSRQRGPVPTAHPGDGDDIAYPTTTNAAASWSLHRPAPRHLRGVGDSGVVAVRHHRARHPTSTAHQPALAAVTLTGGASTHRRRLRVHGLRPSPATGSSRTSTTTARFDVGEGIAGVDVDLMWFGPTTSSSGGDDVAYTTTTDWARPLPVRQPSGRATTRITVDTASLPAGLRNIVDPDGGRRLDRRHSISLGRRDRRLARLRLRRHQQHRRHRVRRHRRDGVQDAGEPGPRWHHADTAPRRGQRRLVRDHRGHRRSPGCRYVPVRRRCPVAPIAST